MPKMLSAHSTISHLNPRSAIAEFRSEEAKAKLVPAQLRSLYQLNRNQRDNAEDAQCAQHHQPLESPVGYRRVASRQQEGANCRELDRARLRWVLSAGRIRFRLNLNLGDAYVRHVGVHLA